MKQFALLIALHAATSFAQIDLNAIMQQQAGGQGGTVQQDNDPFTPNLFIGSFTMEMHVFKGTVEEKNSPILTTITNSAEKTLMETRMPGAKQDMRMIIDLKEKWQYMLMDDGKGRKSAMKTRKMKVAVGDGNAESGDAQVTEETKTIDGHLCTKLISTNKDGTWTGWLANDIHTPFAEVMRGLGVQGVKDRSQEIAGIHGFPLEYDWVSADGKERVLCHIRDLQQGVPDVQVFSLDGYEVMELPSFGR